MAPLRIPVVPPSPSTEEDVELVRRIERVQNIMDSWLEMPLTQKWSAYLDEMLDPESVLREALVTSGGRKAGEWTAHVSWEEMKLRVSSIRESLRNAIIHSKKASGIKGKLSKRRIRLVRRLVVRGVVGDVLVTRCLNMAPERGLVRMLP